MEISASVVKQLRDKTGVGMMECKSALVEAKGDLAEAEKILRKKGLAVAAHKAGRAAGEGLIAAEATPRGAVLVEVNCETDFAARGDDFKSFVREVVEHVVIRGLPTPGADPVAEHRDTLMAATMTTLGDRSLEQRRGEVVGKIGENIQVRRFVRFDAGPTGRVASYIHTGSKIGVLVEADAGPDGDGALRDVAMHVAAAAPRFVRRDEIPETILDDEKEIARAQAVKAGKPPQVVEKIVAGRIDKFFGESCLLEQPFVKDPDKTVGQMLGESIRVTRFARFVLGEGD